MSYHCIPKKLRFGAVYGPAASLGRTSSVMIKTGTLLNIFVPNWMICTWRTCGSNRTAPQATQRITINLLTGEAEDPMGIPFSCLYIFLEYKKYLLSVMQKLTISENSFFAIVVCFWMMSHLLSIILRAYSTGMLGSNDTTSNDTKTSWSFVDYWFLPWIPLRL